MPNPHLKLSAIPGLDQVAKRLKALDPSNVDAQAAHDWWTEFRAPLLKVGVAQLLGVLQARATGVSDAELAVRYAQLTPAELNSVMAANAATFATIASERGKEAALLRLVGEKLSAAASNLLLTALLTALGGLI